MWLSLRHSKPTDVAAIHVNKRLTLFFAHDFERTLECTGQCLRRVNDFGMELERVDFARGICHRRKWARVTVRQFGKASGQLRNLVAVGAEPFLNLSPKMERILREKGAATLDLQKSKCETEGVRCETALETGIVTSVIVTHAAAAGAVYTPDAVTEPTGELSVQVTPVSADCCNPIPSPKAKMIRPSGDGASATGRCGKVPVISLQLEPKSSESRSPLSVPARSASGRRSRGSPRGSRSPAGSWSGRRA